MNDVREIDGRVQVSEEAALATARRILSEASQWKPTLMIGPPPVTDDPRKARVRGASERLATLCNELKVPYFDSNRLLLQNEVWLQDIAQVDGTHPAASGYAEWARLIDAWYRWRQWLP